MKMKKSQLKEAVKTVVRQCLNERLAKEGCGSGKKRFTGKAGRMFGHVEKSEKEQGKSTKVAKKIAGATVNKKLKEQLVGPIADEGMGADSKQTPMDDIVKFVMRKVPAIANNPQKVARVAGLLFQHQYGNQPPDPDTLLTVVQKHMKAVPSAPGGDEQAECGGMEQEGGSMQDEAGLTSETSPEGVEGGEGYDEKEEILLIKVMALIAKKLEAMHAGMEGGDAQIGMDVGTEEPEGEPSGEPSAPPFGGGEEEPSEEPSAPPFGGGEEEPSEEPSEPEEKPEPEEPSEPKEKPEKKDKKEKPVDEASFKQVAPRSATDAKEDKARRIQTEPKVNETATGMKMGPQYKTVAPRQARVTSDDQARTIQFDPEMTENHKVQVRSYKTSDDMDNKPKNVRDPEVPMSETKTACRHSHYTRRDDGGYECSNCGKLRSKSKD
jgi:hypothetical protein